MEKHCVGLKKTTNKGGVLISIFIIAILVLSSGSLVAFAKSNTYVVKPDGTDDTANIQAAFAACGTNLGCTVQLAAGTYHISQISVYGFQGRLVGMGQGMTVIQALPNLPSPNLAYNTPSTPFWAGLPGPSNPWPDLFTFVGGSFSISGMTISDPYTAPTDGWYDLGTTLYTSLFSAILVTGEQQASVKIDHVTILGATGDILGTNMWNGVIYGGQLLPSGWTNAATEIILTSGAFSLTNSAFNSAESGVWVNNIIDTTTMVCGNTVTNSPVALGFYDVSNSKLTYCGNQVSVSGASNAALEAWQSLYKTSGLLPSTVYVSDNNLQVSGGAEGVALFDYGTPSTLSARVVGNVIRTDTSCGCYTPSIPVVLTYSLKSVSVSLNAMTNTPSGGAPGIYVSYGPGQVIGNAITGAYSGVWVDYANGVQVTANVIKNSAEYGIAVTDGSSNNMITGNFVHNSGAYDLYWDGSGTGNIWHWNFCSTSNPSGLC